MYVHTCSIPRLTALPVKEDIFRHTAAVCVLAKSRIVYITCHLTTDSFDKVTLK